MADPKNKKKQVAFGCLFWIAFILLILVIFFLKKDKIETVLKQTSFFERLFNTTAVVDNTETPAAPEDLSIRHRDDTRTQDTQTLPITVVQDTQGTAGTSSSSGNTSAPADSVKPQTPAQTAPVQTPPSRTPASGTPDGGNSASQPAIVASGTKDTPPPRDKPAEQTPQTKTRQTQLYFIQIDKDGDVLRKEVTRAVPVSDSPLTDAIQLLLRGPDEAERKKGLISLIPPGTKLLSATVQNGVAVLNLSEDFQFNQYGIQGYMGQMMQIVYTATAFPTVTSVQFLIEGQKKEYLGAEGIWAGSPLGRDYF